MFAFGAIIIDRHGSYRIEPGILVCQPAELLSITAVKRFQASPHIGWRQDDRDFWDYAVPHEDGHLLVPGIMLEGEGRPRSKFYGYTDLYPRDKIERFVAGIESYTELERLRMRNQLNMIVHDLRGVASTIHHAAHEAINEISIGSYDAARNHMDTVIFAQTMLTMRTDVIDYVENPSTVIEYYDIPIYKKFDKVVKILQPKAKSEGKWISIIGPSYNTVYGPEIFDIVPFIVIDNAVKYSPKGKRISVRVDDGDSETLVKVISWGPKIEESERFAIFDSGTRASGALDSAKPGSGIGLNAAKQIVENKFNGAITVHQDDSFSEIDSVSYYNTEFQILIPTDGRIDS